MEDNSINTTNNYGKINSKLLELLDTYNITDILQDNDDLKKDGVIYSQSHQSISCSLLLYRLYILKRWTCH